MKTYINICVHRTIVYEMYKTNIYKHFKVILIFFLLHPQTYL